VLKVHASRVGDKDPISLRSLSIFLLYWISMDLKYLRV
jgi:hypothetical protein